MYRQMLFDNQSKQSDSWCLHRYDVSLVLDSPFRASTDDLARNDRTFPRLIRHLHQNQRNFSLRPLILARLLVLPLYTHGRP